MKKLKKYQFSFQELSDKDIKSLKILELITRKGVISRTEISKATGINIVSTSNYIKEYIADKLVLEKGFDVSTGGRKPELIELDKSDNRVIGAHIAQEYIYITLTNMGLDIIEKIRIPRPNGKIKDAIEPMCKTIEEMARKAGLAAGGIKAVGLGVKIPAGDHGVIGKKIEDILGIETFVGDEPLCAAFAEKTLNKDALAGDILYIYSDAGNAVVVKNDGSIVSRSESKYLGPWSDEFGILRLAKYDVARGVGTSMVELAHGRIDNMSIRTVIDAAAGRDEVALSIMRSVGMILGLRIAYLVNIFGPKTVVIGGGFEAAGDLILEPIKKMIGKLALKNYSGTTVMPGMFSEDAVSIGAATLAAREIFLEA
ncbi:MAG: ROK family protein [Candidatus Omnitrophica bacterium]|jgi:predicted NBD/HSP70 family sugar kinase|nr:ROK family protein [Candidatus Omnitrophota bacterium]